MFSARLPKAFIFSLTHGQAAWVLWHAFSYQGSGPNQTFDAYLKYLRRNGVPFGAAELGRGAGHNVAYGYEHLMEVAFALALKAQGILKTDVVKLLAELRPELRPLYVDAWLERETGRGKPVEVRVEGTPAFQASGLWLDLQLLSYTEGESPMVGTPRLLSPSEALLSFATHNRQRALRNPVQISDLAAEIVRLVPHAPEIRRGRS